ncbi:alpha/beta hydrolase [Actinocorallia sp. API 0066]|uniref:alpha/beta fold hydrolase n=1 Tax=Actinocorallia sp. API 0066 TaxID=2896846 RepID=UPI001E427D93|nr:alpha/beta fold hydrolase [Actinocorallia sp. API 0066]MCD0448062.1 alpha/beta hydrolase [Actinocorallia sp. API 0066]
MSTPRFLDLPPVVRRTTLRTARGVFAVLEALPVGEPERCPALLVPGYTGSKEDFLGILQTLTRAGRRVVAMDLRGQYESPGSPDHPESYRLAALGADVRSVAAELGPEPVHLVGHSFGGLVTRETVLAEPTAVASYTLMSSGPGAISGPSAERAAALRDALAVLSMSDIWDIKLGPDAIAAGRPGPVIAFLRERSVRTCPRGLIEMAGELLSAPDKVEDLCKVCDDADLPLMVLFGEDDDAWDPRVQAAMADRLDAVRVVIPGAAHSPAWEAPETTAHALTDFWNSAERR